LTSKWIKGLCPKCFGEVEVEESDNYGTSFRCKKCDYLGSHSTDRKEILEKQTMDKFF